jgi:hypothetical protein
MIKISIKDKETGIQKEIKISRTLSGDYILNEHPHFDVIVMPEKSKVLVIAKETQDDHVYDSQDKLLKYMVQKGVLLPESIKAGNIFGSLEGSYIQMPPGGENPSQVAIFSIASFIEDERPIIAREKEFEDRMEKELLQPPVQDSTELGEVPQEPFKGSIPKYGFPTRGIYRYNY